MCSGSVLCSWTCILWVVRFCWLWQLVYHKTYGRLKCVAHKVSISTDFFSLGHVYKTRFLAFWFGCEVWYMYSLHCLVIEYAARLQVSLCSLVCTGWVSLMVEYQPRNCEVACLDLLRPLQATLCKLLPAVCSGQLGLLPFLGCGVKAKCGWLGQWCVC